jgi:two-component system, response regulator PdtaR
MDSPPTGHLALVVEDEPLIRLFTAATLREAGFDTLEAANAEEAMRYLDADTPVAALVTDIDLPGHVNGFGLAWRAHSLRAAVVVISGRLVPPPELLPPGARFLTKPVREDQLIAALSDLLPGQRGR